MECCDILCGINWLGVVCGDVWWRMGPAEMVGGGLLLLKTAGVGLQLWVEELLLSSELSQVSVFSPLGFCK